MKIYTKGNYMNQDMEQVFGLRTILETLNAFDKDEMKINRDRIIMSLLFNTEKENPYEVLRIIETYKQDILKSLLVGFKIE